jgi:hypothetical protein
VSQPALYDRPPDDGIRAQVLATNRLVKWVVVGLAGALLLCLVALVLMAGALLYAWSSRVSSAPTDDAGTVVRLTGPCASDTPSS